MPSHVYGHGVVFFIGENKWQILTGLAGYTDT
jgi:hypothetical protein